jgi:CheY-like chemotaxis protein
MESRADLRTIENYWEKKQLRDKQLKEAGKSRPKTGSIRPIPLREFSSTLVQFQNSKDSLYCSNCRLSEIHMTDVLVIDNENVIAPAIDAGKVKFCVYDDEIQALNALEAMRPEIAVLNYSMQRNRTAAFISLLSKANERSKIVLIAENLTDEEIVNCLIAGAKGYLQIHEVEKFINKLFQAIRADEAWITRRMVAKLLERLRNHSV